MKTNKNPFNNTSNNIYTDTYLSTFTNADLRQPNDKNVYKAIKQNNAEILVQRDREQVTTVTELYDAEKQLNQVIIDMRKRYDCTKIQTSKVQKTVNFMEEEMGLLEMQFVKMKEHFNPMQQHIQTSIKHENSQFALQNIQLMKDVRLSMQDRLKKDILHYKKMCFDRNVELIRARTSLRDAGHKQLNKKHLTSKCKLVLTSLQQTVAVRQNDRLKHLKQMQTILLTKMQNNQLKTNREQQIKQSMYRALTDRLPQQIQLIHKYYAENVLRFILRSKMHKLMNHYKDVEQSFNRIRKETRITGINQFIQGYLNKQKKYGDLLESIQRNEKRIELQKQERKRIEQEFIKLNSFMVDLEGQLLQKSKNKGTQALFKKLNYYNQIVPKCSQLSIILKKWAVKTIVKLGNLQHHSQNHNLIEQYQNLSLQKSAKLSLQTMIKVLNQQSTIISSPEKPSQLSTQRSEERINLTSLTSESVLSKQYSRRNFRVKTLTAPEQTHQQHDRQYDQVSQFDFLKMNRRLVKKNHKSAVRARIKTRAF